MLPVNTSVQDVISAVVKPGGDHVLVKMNSAGGQEAFVWKDGACATGGAFCPSSVMKMPVNGLVSHRKSSAEVGRCCGFHGAGRQRETLHLHQQPSGETGQFSKPVEGRSGREQPGVNNTLFSKFPLKEQQGPERGTADILEQMSSKDIATELTNYDWELFTAMHEVPAQTRSSSGEELL